MVVRETSRSKARFKRGRDSSGGTRRRSGKLETAKDIQRRFRKKSEPELVLSQLSISGGVGSDVVKTLKQDGEVVSVERVKTKRRGRPTIKREALTVKSVSKSVKTTGDVKGKGLRLVKEPLRRIERGKLVTKKKTARPKQRVLGRIEPDKPGRLETVRRKIKGVTQKTESEFQRQLAGTVGLGTLGLVRGGVGVFKALARPDKFIKEQAAFAKALAKDPKGTSKSIVDEFSKDPAGFAGELVGFAKTAGFVGATAKRSPAGRFIQEEAFIRNNAGKLSREVKGLTKTEADSFLRAVIKGAKSQEKLSPVDLKKLQKKGVNFFDVKELSKTEAVALKKTLKQDATSFVFGSKAARLFSEGKTKLPKDVDLATGNVKAFSEQFIKNLPKNQRGKYLIKGEKVVRKSDGVGIVDVKEASRLTPEKGITGKGRLPVVGEKKGVSFTNKKGDTSVLPRIEKKLITDAFTPTQKRVKVGGIKLVGFGEQTTRKALGTLQVLIERNPRRAKDPAALVESLKIQRDATKSVKKKKELGDAVKVLESKKFVSLLDKRVPGLTKEFPILSKLDSAKLKKAQKFRDRQTIDFTKDVKEFKFKDLGETPRKPVSRPKPAKPGKTVSKPRKLVEKAKKPVSEQPSRIPKKKKTPSSVTPTRKTKPSRLAARTSRVPKKTSKVPSKPPSKVPSTIKPSQIKTIDPTPAKTSKVPSRLVSKLPASKLPTKKTTSRLASKKPVTKKVVPTKKKKEKKVTKTKISKLKKTKEVLKFTTTIESPTTKIKKKKLEELPFFTGLELRG